MRDCPNVGCSRSSAKDQFERARKPGLRGYSAAGGASSRKNEKVVSRIITNRNDLATRAVPVAERVEWQISRDPVPYVAALAAMDKRVAAIANGTLPELVWLLEHPPLYTAGTSAKPQALIAPRLPVYAAGRGGQ